jgi:hypothetical protein
MKDRSSKAGNVALKWTLRWNQFDNALSNAAIDHLKA